MSMWLRQSTASQEILLGRFVDSVDGNTEKTALTITNTDVKLWKEGATTLASKNSGGATHIANGLYSAVLDATDSDTLGKLEVHVHVTGALPIRREYMVLPANVYDSLLLGTDVLQADVAQWLGTAAATPTVAGVPEVDVTYSAGVAVTIGDLTLASATATTVTLPSTYADGSALPDDDRYQDCALQVVGGTGVGQVIFLTKAAAGARQYNVLSGSMPVTLDNTSVCLILGAAPSALLRSSIAQAASVNRTVAEALALLRNRFTAQGGVLTVFDTDDATVLWTGVLQGDAGAQPVVGMDPN